MPTPLTQPEAAAAPAPAPVNATEQVRYEAGLRPRYAGLAVLAGILIVIQAVIQVTGPHTTVSELTLDLITAHRRFPLDVIGACVDCVGLLVLAATLSWLHAIARARNPQIRDLVRWLVVVGAILSGVMAIAYSVFIAIKANQFVAHGNQGYLEASALTSGGLVTVLPVLAQLGSLLLAAGFIWTALNAMRVGLLTRFMGYLGVFAGVLVLIPIGSPVPVVQGFWLVALGVLLAGRWPNGAPPAWETGEAVPWTPMSQPRERPARQAPRQRTTRRQLEGAARGAPAAPGNGAGGDAQAAPRTRATTSKRKRKRRH